MNIENPDFKEIAADLLWDLYVRSCHENDDSMFAVVTHDIDKNTEKDNNESVVGNLIRGPEFYSYTLPKYKKLTYADLGVILGLTPERYVSDGHDCSKCPNYLKCTAYFKDDKRQLQCNYWKEQIDNSVYNYNLDHQKEELLKDINQ